MNTPNDRRQTTAILILGVISLAAFLLIAKGTPPTAVTDVLAIVFPPLVAIAAHAERGSRSGKQKRRQSK